MSKTKDPFVLDDLSERIADVSAALSDSEQQSDWLRHNRNALFVQAYDARAISVTEMARIAGVRRETVHEAINRTKRESNGS